MIESFATFLDDVGEAASLTQARRAAGRLAARLGVPLALITRTRDDPETGFPMPEAYDTDLRCFDDYLAAGLYRRDPFFLQGLAPKRPVLMALDRSAWGAMTENEEQVFEARVSSEATYRIAVPGASGADGVSWIAAYSSEEPLDDVEASRAASMLWIATAAIGERLLGLDDPALPEVRLDPDEREAVVRLAAGQQGMAVAARLGLTDAAMSALIARAGRRIGARSRPEVVGRSLARGLVRP